MTVDKELARQLAYLYQQASGLLVHTICLMEHHGPEAQRSEQKLAVARLLTELGTELLYPIYRAYPDLEPPAAPPDGEPTGHPMADK